MAEFSVNAYRLDPYASWGFHVKWDGKIVPGITRIGGLAWTTEALPFRNGADPADTHVVPGLTTYAPLVLERGRTHDTAFEDWANLVGAVANPRSLKTFRKDVTIELLNEQRSIVMAFRVLRCWPSHYSPLGPLDADANLLALETLTLQNEGFERDTGVKEPAQT